MTEPTMCLTNITAKGRRRRFALGGVVISATFVATSVLPKGPVTAWSLVALVPLGFGWLCVVQAAENT